MTIAPALAPTLMPALAPVLSTARSTRVASVAAAVMLGLEVALALEDVVDVAPELVDTFAALVAVAGNIAVAHVGPASLSPGPALNSASGLSQYANFSPRLYACKSLQHHVSSEQASTKWLVMAAVSLVDSL